MNGFPESDRAKIARYREASEWLLRLRNSTATEVQVEEWLRWCDADPKNLTAFETLQQDWEDAAGFKSSPELLTMSAQARFVSTSELPSAPAPIQSIALGGDSEPAGVRWRTLSGMTSWGLAASILTIAAALAWQRWFQAPSHEVVIAASQEHATLPDGSAMQLSAKASAEVNFSHTTRHVVLRPGGELYVKVRHEKTRAFTVDAGEMMVTALGTAFDVRREAGRVVVTVEEGAILASAIGPGGPAQWRVDAGYQVSYSKETHVAVVSRVDAHDALRWRDGELAYDDTALDVVIADINRYSSVNLVIKDPALRELHFTGTVFVASIDDWIKALEDKYPVRAQRSSSGTIELEAPAKIQNSHHHSS